MTSQIVICNRALSKLGEQRITSLSDDVKAARAVSAAFDSVRDDELRANGWAFAMKRDQLAAEVVPPAFGFSYRYQLPTDCVRPWRIGEWWWAGPDLSDYRNAEAAPYSIEAGFILTSEGQAASGTAAALNLIYLYRVTDTNQWDANFVEAFACRLAMEVCDELTQSDTKADKVEGQYDKAIARAHRVNAIQMPPQYIADDSWVTARMRG